MDKEYIKELLVSTAKFSNCHKRRFGALAIKNNTVLGLSANNKLPHHKHLCKQGCIRTTIPSRTDSMIGACGHAEEQIIWMLANRIVDYDLYVLQIDQNDNIIYKDGLDFSCVRCATAMYYGKVRGVWLLLDYGFGFIPTAKAIQTAYYYALGKKKAEY